MAASTTEDKSPKHLATFPWVFTMTLDDGKWTLAHREAGQPYTEGAGTYALDGDRLAFTWPQDGYSPHLHRRRSTARATST